MIVLKPLVVVVVDDTQAVEITVLWTVSPIQDRNLLKLTAPAQPVEAIVMEFPLRPNEAICRNNLYES